MCQSEIKNVFDLLHVSGYFSHGNGFTPVWLVGTEKTLFLMPLKTVLVFYPDILKKRKTRLKKKHLED